MVSRERELCMAKNFMISSSPDGLYDKLNKILEPEIASGARALANSMKNLFTWHRDGHILEEKFKGLVTEARKDLKLVGFSARPDFFRSRVSGVSGVDIYTAYARVAGIVPWVVALPWKTVNEDMCVSTRITMYLSDTSNFDSLASYTGRVRPQLQLPLLNYAESQDELSPIDAYYYEFAHDLKSEVVAEATRASDEVGEWLLSIF